MIKSDRDDILLYIVDSFGSTNWNSISDIKPDDREKAKKFYNLVKKFTVDQIAEYFNVSPVEVSLLYNKCSYWKPVEPVTFRQSLE